ncbi:ROK family protein [Seonamhaeicola sediminis]|uniref:ROK family protein n=1 Tax=Seonamhaeicola sediminis TaxID=2528206 RepID=A0A562YI13_9FLAO|nr:ROK family protein [Seonamhaeicola sediminis]TWO34683.1 ROK family protein [Seonamhaeicola sediminis]
MKNIAIGVDVGGSHISCMGFDLENQQLLPDTFSENCIDNHAMPNAIIQAWGTVIKHSIAKIGVNNVAGIGFAMPGPFDYLNGISCFNGQNGKYEHTYGMNVRERLTEFLNLSQPVKIRFINDATAFALGEAKFGKAKTYKSILSITLGTGFGSAFIKNGVPVVHGNEVPQGGCLWHLPFENSVADDYFSTRGLINRFEQKTGYKCEGVKDIVALCGTNTDAKQLLEDFGEKMASFLHPWIRKSNVEVIVLGGNISRAYPLFGKSLKSYFNSVDLRVDIVVSDLKEKSAFMGSAILIDNKTYDTILPVLQKM